MYAENTCLASVFQTISKTLFRQKVRLYLHSDEGVPTDTNGMSEADLDDLADLQDLANIDITTYDQDDTGSNPAAKRMRC